MSLLLALQGSQPVTLTRDEAIPVESLLAVTLARDDAIPVESRLGVAIGQGFPVEHGGVLTQGAAIPIDTVAGAAVRNFQTSAEYGATYPYGQLEYGEAEFFTTFRRDDAIPVESVVIAVTVRDATIPVEHGLLLARLETIPVETSPGIVSGETIPIDNVVGLRRDEAIPIDNLEGVAAGDRVETSAEYGEKARNLYGNQEYGEAEFLITLRRDESIPIEASEAAAAITRDESIPIEQRTGVTRDDAIPIESLIGVMRDDAIPVETLIGLRRDDEIPVESLIGITRDDAIPVESQFPTVTLDRDEDIPVEFGQALLRDSAIPIDNTGAITLVRDEEIPVESIVTAVPFDFLNWLAGGGGAPWPPSWLRRPALLARERHCAGVRYFGRSRQRVRPAPPRLIPSIKVPTRVPTLPAPRPRRWTVTATLRTRQRGRAVTILGGRSRQVVGHDWDMIRRGDENELFTLVQLL